MLDRLGDPGAIDTKIETGPPDAKSMLSEFVRRAYDQDFLRRQIEFEIQNLSLSELNAVMDLLDSFKGESAEIVDNG